MRNHHQNRALGDTLDSERQHFERRWVDPVDVFKNDEQRPNKRQKLNLHDQRINRLPPPLLRWEIHSGRFNVFRWRYKVSDERKVVRLLPLDAQNVVDFLSFLRKAVVPFESRGALDITNERIERRILLARRAEIL